MTIVLGSRYMGQPVTVVPVDAQGDTAAAVFGPPPTTSPNFSYYTVNEGDRFDTLSYQVYGLPDYWWRIANANPEVFYPDYLVVGSIIRIPST
jgi:nucleoid-associated protein YgaU